MAEVARGDEILQAALVHRQDVALLDIEMPGDVLGATHVLRDALLSCCVVMLTTFGAAATCTGP